MSARIYQLPGSAQAVKNKRGWTPADEDGLPTTSAKDEMVVKISYQDRLGRIQYSVTRTTASLADIQSKKQFKARLTYYYKMSGSKLLTLELVTEHSTTIQGAGAKPRLHLVRGPERRGVRLEA